MTYQPCTSPWWGGLTCDHLYRDCPNYVRGLPQLVRYSLDHVSGPQINPHGGDVCGLCVHRHNQTMHKAVAA